MNFISQIKAMFDDLAENQKNQVDIDEDIFEEIILIYTGK